jgi:hypothetical protein
MLKKRMRQLLRWEVGEEEDEEGEDDDDDDDDD